jgi:2-heptyl-3-hydroxy-4(1H)-quinolone synthase
VPAVLEQIERPEQLIHNDLEEIEQTPWHRERVVLVGDAAHAVTPNMGQGAAMALEDSAVLAVMLAEKRPLAETLAAWEARRRPRVRFVQLQSRRIGRVGHWQGRAACAVRNGLLRLTPDRAAAAALARLVGRPF